MTHSVARLWEKNTLMDGCCERQMHGGEFGKGWKMTYAPPFDSAILLPGTYPRDMLQKY